MATSDHCPGFEPLKTLASYICECPECGTRTEIFSDEFAKKTHCKSCGEKVDFKQFIVEEQQQ